MPKAATPKTIGLRATGGKRTLRFGLVSVGVSMGPALDTSARVPAKYACPTTLGPVTQQYVNTEGHVVKPVRAYPYGDRMVRLEDDECPKLEGTDTVTLTANLFADELPVEWITGTHLCWPTDKTQDDAYMLVSNYLLSNGRVFIGKVIDHGTTKVLAIRFSEVYGCLVAHTLAYRGQVRWDNVEAIREGLATIAAPDPAMASMAATLFDSIGDDFDWSEVRDEYGERLAAAIREKGERGYIEPTPEAVDTPKAPNDLLEALRASLETITDEQRAAVKVDKGWVEVDA